MAVKKKAKVKKKVNRGRNNGKLGHPTSYRPEYDEQIIEFSKKGYTIAQVCAEWGIARETLYLWVKDKEQKGSFGVAFRAAKEHREVWWTKFGINLMAGKVPKGNATAFIWMTKNILRWRDVPEEENDEAIDDLIFD